MTDPLQITKQDWIMVEKSTKMGLVFTDIPPESELDRIENLFPGGRAKLIALAEAARDARLAKQAARDEQARQIRLQLERLRDDLERACNTAGHPKAGLLWDKAYDRGHSDGDDQIRWHYEDLVELLS